MRRSRSWVATTIGCLLLSGALAAHAQSTADAGVTTAPADSLQASKAFWRGKEYYDAGQYGLALEHFEEAYLLTNDPTLLYDIGQCYRQMGDCGHALESYQEFLGAAPTSPLAAQAEKQISLLRSRCPSWQAEADSSDSSVDRQDPTAPSPSPRRRSPVAYAAPSSSRVAPQPSTVSATSSGAVSATSSSAASESLQTISPDLPIHRLRTWTVVVLAAGLAAGGAAGALEIWNEERYQQWSKQNRSLALGIAAGQTIPDWLARQDENDRLGQSIQGVDRAALMIGLGGASLVAASAILYWMSPSETSARPRAPRQTSAAAFQPTTLSAGPMSVSLRGAF